MHIWNRTQVSHTKGCTCTPIGGRPWGKWGDKKESPSCLALPSHRGKPAGQRNRNPNISANLAGGGPPMADHDEGQKFDGIMHLLTLPRKHPAEVRDKYGRLQGLLVETCAMENWVSDIPTKVRHKYSRPKCWPSKKIKKNLQNIQLLEVPWRFWLQWGGQSSRTKGLASNPCTGGALSSYAPGTQLTTLCPWCPTEN